MNKDTRITVGLALVYFLNGLFNLSGQAGKFAPMIIYDSFFLAVLCMVFCFLPPFKPSNLLFVVFASCFLLQQCFMLGWVVNVRLDIITNIFFLVLCAACFIWALFLNRNHPILFSVPLIGFGAAIIFGYYEVNVYYKLSASLVGALAQVLVLARPEIVEKLNVTVKRFYLLMSIMVFFDLLATVFLHQNLS